MTINVSEALDSDTASLLTVERTGVGVWENGIYVKGSVSTFKSLISPQQPTPDQLQTLSDGERDKDIMLFISKRRLRTTDDRKGLIADVVLFDDNRYKIIEAAKWFTFGFVPAFGAKE